jgi:hypothetical protein
MAAKFAVALVLPALLLTTGCGGGAGRTGSTTTAASRPTTRPLTYSEVYTLPLGTTELAILRRFGPPLRPDRVKPLGVVATCYRYYAANDVNGVDPRYQWRLCYDRRHRLSLKTTAPAG